LARGTTTAPIPSHLVLVVLFLTRCHGGIDQTLELKIEQNYNLPSGASLSVSNEDGSIRLYGAESRDVYVEALKRGYSAERLDAIKVQASEQKGMLAIKTIFPPKSKWSLRDRSGTVDYVIIFPQDTTISKLDLVNGEISIDGLRGGSARAVVLNGRLSARNCFGDLDYKVVNGAVDFYYNWWEDATYFVKAAIANGSMGAFLPRSASFRVEAETQAGSVTTNFEQAEQSRHDGRKKLVAKIGTGVGPTYHIEATSGNIQIEGY
jgi:hypothetical protein